MVRPEELGATLIARRREERLREQERAAELRAVLGRAIAAELRPGAQAWLIGSLAWGGFGPHSDADVVVAGLDSAAAMQLGAELLARAGLPVHLLRLEELPEAFRQRVRSKGIPVGRP